MSPDMQAYVRELVDRAPAFTEAERQSLAQLLRRPPHDEGAARQPRPRPLNATPPAAKLVGGCDARR
jgi:hypothetical protein